MVTSAEQWTALLIVTGFAVVVGATSPWWARRYVGTPLSAPPILFGVGSGAVGVMLFLSAESITAGVSAGIIGAVGVPLAAIDGKYHRLPDAVTGPLFGVVFLVVLVGCAATGDWGGLLRAVVGAVVLGVFYFLLAFFYPAGMGLGDVKLAPTLGLVLGYVGIPLLILGAFVPFFLAAIFSIVLIVLRRAGAKTAIAFGPFMIAGTAVTLILGPAIVNWYLGG